MLEGSEDEVDIHWMSLALEQARKGRPSPNPHVGAVIVKDGRAVGLGHHERAGLAHAEAMALDAAGAEAQGATLYCTLEPCNHHGRTPPCADAVISSGLSRVVIAAADPLPHIAGAVEKMRAAAIVVDVGVAGEAGRELVADFAHHLRTGLPYAILKAAVTLDGRTATSTGDSKWITSEQARTEVHRMRARADAVMVGVGTVLADDPALTVRHVTGHQPLRIVLDTHLRTPASAQILDDAALTLIVHGPTVDPERHEELRRPGVEFAEVPLSDDGRLRLPDAMALIGARDVVRLLVEGGATVHGGLMAAGLVSEAAIFVAPRIVADSEAFGLGTIGPLGTMAGAFEILSPRIRILGHDVLFEGPLRPGRNDRS